jgi:hypothetical protein
MEYVCGKIIMNKNIINQQNNQLSNDDIIKYSALIKQYIEEIFEEMKFKNIKTQILEYIDDNLHQEFIDILYNLSNEENIPEEELLHLVLRSLHKKFKKDPRFSLIVAREHDDNDLIPKYVKESLKEDLRRAFIYEFYKVVNPNCLAGKTRLENFLNNLFYGGIEYAKQYPGGEYALNKELVSYANKMIKNHFINNNIR